MCKCLSIDTYMYTGTAQLNAGRFVRVSISIYYCVWQSVQKDKEAAFCGIGGYSIHVGLEPVLYISEGKTDTNNMYPNCCSTILLKITDTLLLRYLIKEIGIDGKCHIPTSPVDNNDNLLYLSERISEKIGIDRHFPVPILIQPTAPISLHLMYW